MICSKCGHQNSDNSEFCAECGNDLVSGNGYQDSSGTFFGVSKSDYNSSVYSTPDNHKANSALVFAIVSLVLSNSGLLSLFGTIFAIVGIIKSNKALSEGAGTKAKVARILSIVAIFVSVIFGLIFWSQMMIMFSDIVSLFSSMPNG